MKAIRWRNRTNVGLVEGSLGVHEAAKEILAGAHNRNNANDGRTYCIRPGLCDRTLHLHLVLRDCGRATKCLNR